MLVKQPPCLSYLMNIVAVDVLGAQRAMVFTLFVQNSLDLHYEV